MSQDVYLSIVVPVRNEEAFICHTLESLASQDYPRERCEIIVVDGESTDGTRNAVQAFIERHPQANVRLLHNPGRLSSVARNIGILAARGKLIGVIDGHVLIPNQRLFANMERLKEKHAALCLGRPAPLLVPGLSQGKAFWIAVARKCWLAHSRKSYIYSDYEGFVDPVSSGFAYDRQVFSQIGYFDEDFDAAEDVEFHHRLKGVGIRAYTSPDLTIYSYPRETLSGLFRQMVRYGIGRARCLRKHRGAYTKEQLIPPAIFLFFLCLPLAIVAALWVPWLAAAYAAVFVFYWSTLLISGIVATARRRRIIPSAFVAAALWTIHIGLGYGFVKTMLSPPDSADGGKARMPITGSRET